MRNGPKGMKGFGQIGNGTLFRDVAQMANGAASALGDMRSEVAAKMQKRAARASDVMARTATVVRPQQKTETDDVVPREDFEAALARITALGERITVLEAQLKADSVPKRPAPTKSAKKVAKKANAKKG